MLSILARWYHEHFSDPQAIALAMLLFVTCSLLYFFGSLLSPLFFALIFSYLLEKPTVFFEKLGISRSLAAGIVLIGFVGIMLLGLLVFFPALWKQLALLKQDLPALVLKFQEYSKQFLTRHPDWFSCGYSDIFIETVQVKLMPLGELLIKFSFSSLFNLFALSIYCFIVPFMVFFILKDKKIFIENLTRILPSKNILIYQVWNELDKKIAHYIQGKLIEISIVSIITYILFLITGLPYALLLSALVGLSVLIPYIGAIVVTLPIFLVGLLEWKLSTPFWYMFFPYLAIQALDGNILSPLIFSEAMNLHPLTIIIAILFFGGLWGFWGIFFAIPLATLVKAVLTAWPTVTPQASK